jgi:hypothetical protein
VVAVKIPKKYLWYFIKGCTAQMSSTVLLSHL